MIRGGSQLNCPANLSSKARKREGETGRGRGKGRRKGRERKGGRRGEEREGEGGRKKGRTKESSKGVPWETSDFVA